MVIFLSKKILISSAVLIVILAGSYFYFGRSPEPQYETYTIKRGDLVQEVSVIGKVLAAEEVELAFEKSGRVAAVMVQVGDQVPAGKSLVQLDISELLADLAEARANVKTEEARLKETRGGTRREELEVSEAKVSSAQLALEDAKKNLIDKINDAYTKSDDAIRTKSDQVFSNPRTHIVSFNFVTDLQAKSDLEQKRAKIESTLTQWFTSLNNLSISSGLDLYVKDAKQNLDEIKSFLDLLAFVVNGLSSQQNLTQAKLDDYKADISTARTNINTATANLTAAEEKLRKAESDLVTAQKELDLKKAGSTAEAIRIQEANLEQARARVQNIEAQISKNILRAPFAGIVTKQEAKVGETVQATTPLVGLIGVSGFEIEANVPEADIAKIKLKDSARVTLDAYGDDVVFEATVSKVDPAETIIEGVPTYKTTLQFLQKDDRIKSGMTANVDIKTAMREAVLFIPQRSIIGRGEIKIVRILEDGGEVREAEVKTGLRGSDGNVEIVEGLTKGEEVILFEINKQ